MKEPHGEGAANHTGPEPCGVSRKGDVEALAGERTGQAIEPRKVPSFGTPTMLFDAEGNTLRNASASCEGVPRGRRPWHARMHFAREPGDPVVARGSDGRGTYREV